MLFLTSHNKYINHELSQVTADLKEHQARVYVVNREREGARATQVTSEKQERMARQVLQEIREKKESLVLVLPDSKVSDRFRIM